MRLVPRAACKQAHALQALAVADAGRHESDVAAAGQILGSVDATLVDDTHLLRTSPLLVVPEAKPSEYFRAQAAERRRGKHAFGCAARTHHGVHVGSSDRDGQRGHEIAVLDELDPSARATHVVNELFVSR